ncbi:MAG: tetratricopeptide repeat protein, partial [Candidatus Omnitrophota bacterium]|nr:tetratricopeptide repeat protein [Candidatus Omnitrophota bacterium]
MKRLGVTILLTALVLITGAGLLLAGDTEDQARKELISEHYEHGLACYRQKDYFQAKVEFDKVLVLDPGHKKAKRYSGLALKKAEQYIGRAVEPKTQLSGYLYELGKGYYLLGQYQEAVQKFKQVLLVNPSHEGAQVYLGQIKGQKSLEEIVNKEIAVRQQTKLGVRRRGVGTKDSRQIEKKTEIKVKQDKKAEKGPEKLAKKKAKQEAKEAKKSEKLAKKKA